MTSLRSIWHPDLYHAHGKKPPFFEGWYFKLVTRGEDRAHAVIPGVFLGDEAGDARSGGARSHAFVQTLDGLTGRTTYHRYPMDSFRTDRREFDIWIGPNHFRADRVVLDIQTPERQMQGELRFSELAPWPVSLTSPGIMGWYALVPFMECYHGVVSLDHGITGRLTIDGEDVDFGGGRGYTEKDWGQAFPRAWIWTQSNHFETSGTSLTASVATIPWLGSAFRGFIAGLWHGGRLYRFATYTGAAIERLQVEDDRVALSMRSKPRRKDKRFDRLKVVAWRSRGGLLRSPERIAMLQRVLESLTARLEVQLSTVGDDGERLLFEGVGRHAGLEIVGQLAEIVDSDH
jgi:tocopherol cyclase